MKKTETKDLVRTYFRAKYKQLSSAADLSVCQHPGLIGGHREQVYRLYLQEVLPQRYAVGRGMVYGKSHVSKEADIVIWDSSNYPILPLADHSFFFAESVKLIIECKSNWSLEEFKGVVEKTESIHQILLRKSLSLRDELNKVNSQLSPFINQLDSAKQCFSLLNIESSAEDRLNHIQLVLELLLDTELVSLVHQSYRIGTAALFLKNGADDVKQPEKLFMQPEKYWLSDSFPDILLFLEPGVLVVKERLQDNQMRGIIRFFELGEDCLLIFTRHLLHLLSERSTFVDGRFYFDDYIHPDLEPVNLNPYYSKEFDVSGDYGSTSILRM